MNIRKITEEKFSSLFKKFRRIPEQHHYDFIEFCKEYFSEIQKLEFEEYIEIKYAYVKALYQIDRAYLFYKLADQCLIELLNQRNFTDQYKSIYRSILKLKADRLYEEKKFQQSRKIYQNLLAIYPEDLQVRKRLFNITFRQVQSKQKLLLAFSAILLIFTLILLTSIHFLIIPFFSTYEYIAWKGVYSMMLGSSIIFGYTIASSYKEAKRNLWKKDVFLS